MKMEQSVPKRWHLNSRRRETTQKKTYDINERAVTFQKISSCYMCKICFSTGRNTANILQSYSKSQSKNAVNTYGATQ
jgi:hypothetical protein